MSGRLIVLGCYRYHSSYRSLIPSIDTPRSNSLLKADISFNNPGVLRAPEQEGNSRRFRHFEFGYTGSNAMKGPMSIAVRILALVPLSFAQSSLPSCAVSYTSCSR